jgi:hypothetical protein
MCLQFGFIVFWRKDFGTKAAHKMLVKLTPEWQSRSCLIVMLSIVMLSIIMLSIVMLCITMLIVLLVNATIRRYCAKI